MPLAAVSCQKLAIIPTPSTVLLFSPARRFNHNMKQTHAIEPIDPHRPFSIRSLSMMALPSAVGGDPSELIFYTEDTQVRVRVCEGLLAARVCVC